MQDYYRLLGVPLTASQLDIEQAYQRQKARLSRRTADPAMKARLQEVNTGYEILGHPGRRLAYNVLLAQEPAHELPADPTEVMMSRYAPAARWLNGALVAFCLLLALDWVLPLREYAGEVVLVRQIVSVSSSASDPQMAYDVTTPRTAFRVPSRLGHRVRKGQRLTVAQTPLLGVARRIVAPPTTPGELPFFKPSGGNIYGAFSFLPLVLLVVAGLGLLPRRTPEMRVNTAVVGLLLAIVTLVVLVWF
ncbi:J domain-containing protein [Hymenobacter lucidus]|uniref:J domain-containing protein n=1 Tax=Hymenobacter lucidus TaxID=2880930 RepID=A0ABS8AMN4_9BACT|nr:J domain-containing protein [Hymenobacter lucidus]MCB2407450.1 J domain-containing protein [Hymenobacter lucidus]